MSWAELGRRKGWDVLNKKGRRARLRESIALLTSIGFTYELLDGTGQRFSNMPLFQHTAHVDRGNGRLGTVINVNPLLWKSMMDQQRAIVYDRAVLKVPLDRGRGDWVFRLYRYLMAQISMGWQSKQLAEQDGRFTVQLEALLAGAGVPYQKYLHTTGGTRPQWAPGHFGTRCGVRLPT